MSDKITLSMQIEEIKQQIRTHWDAGFNHKNMDRMRRAEYAHSLERKKAILQTLEFFQKHRTEIIDAVHPVVGVQS